MESDKDNLLHAPNEDPLRQINQLGHDEFQEKVVEQEDEDAQTDVDDDDVPRSTNDNVIQEAHKRTKSTTTRTSTSHARSHTTQTLATEDGPKRRSQPPRPQTTRGGMQTQQQQQQTARRESHWTNITFDNSPPTQYQSGGGTNQPASYQNQQTLLMPNNSEAAYIENRWMRSAFLIFEDPSSSRLALWFNVSLAICIIFNALTVVIETDTNMNNHPKTQRVFLALEMIFTFLFSIEFLARIFAHAYSWTAFRKFVWQTLTLLDFLAFLPFWIEIVLFGKPLWETQKLSVLRLFRLFRIFKAYKYDSMLQLSIEVMIIAFKKSVEPLLSVLLFIFVWTLSAGTLMHFAERGTYDETLRSWIDRTGRVSQFESIPKSIWFVVVTLTTTGYGDMAPITTAGRFVTFSLMIVGVLLIALPSIIVGRNFIAVWEVMRRYRRTKPKVEEESGGVVGGGAQGKFGSAVVENPPIQQSEEILRDQTTGQDSIHIQMLPLSQQQQPVRKPSRPSINMQQSGAPANETVVLDLIQQVADMQADMTRMASQVDRLTFLLETSLSGRAPTNPDLARQMNGTGGPTGSMQGGGGAGLMTPGPMTATTDLVFDQMMDAEAFRLRNEIL